MEVQADLHSAQIHAQQGKINCLLSIFWIDLHSAQNAYVRKNPGSGGRKPESATGKPESARGDKQSAYGKPESARGYTESAYGTSAARSEIHRLSQY